MPAPREKQPDQGRIVAWLALECRMPVAEMAALYERERARLATDARITKFLHVFATRKVLETLSERGLDEPASKPVEPAPIAV
jgi:hypothetical protein